MKNETRVAFGAYLSQIAHLSGVPLTAVAQKFAVAPTVQQKLEQRIQESSEFLSKINVVGVDEQSGQVLGLGVTGPIAGTTDTNAADRQTRDVASLNGREYFCRQINYDTHIRYATLDMWAKFPNFQEILRNAIIKQIALDRMMIGFNGVSRAATSDRNANPLLQDVAKGWLQKIREEAPEQNMKEVKPASGKVKIGDTVAAADGYKNLDALVFDAVELLDPWYQQDPDLVVIMGRGMLADKYFPLLNKVQPNSEMSAADLIISQKRVGGLQAVAAPYFPAGKILITKLSNLSIYYQNGAQRRSVVEVAKRDRIETYQSSNDDYVVEDHGAAVLIENIEIVVA